MLVCYNPYKEDAINKNKYIKLVSDAIKMNSYEVDNLRNVLTDFKKFKNTKVFNLNWYENIYEKSVLKAYLEYVFKRILLIVLKVSNKKIIWTMHNKIPHNASNVKICKKMMASCIKSSDIIVIHSKESIDIIKSISKDINVVKKVRYIPHPNYVGVYKEKSIVNIPEKNKKIRMLFMGQIRPYKNVELLIKIAKKFKNIEIIIAGKPINDEYRDYLLNKVSGLDNIITIFRFIENDEIASIINSSDLMIFPYDIESSLNSGSILMAFSYKKTVISPLIGTLKDFNEKDLFFSYEYDSENEHLNKLEKIILTILEKQEKDKNYLKVLGENVYKIIEHRYSVNEISKKYGEIYKELLE